jgi:uncharacterized membrane protein HdeD (DUF308 family)
MADLTSTRTRSDLVIGGLVVLASLVILGNAAVATTVSVKFLGWILFTVGVVLLVGALVSIGKDGFWGAAIGGGLATALGVGFLRNTERGAVTLTLIAGMMFLFSGLARLAIAYQLPVARVPMLISGGIATLLGLVVLFNLFDASDNFLGLIIGIELLFEGLAIMIVGRTGMTGHLNTTYEG